MLTNLGVNRVRGVEVIGYKIGLFVANRHQHSLTTIHG